MTARAKWEVFTFFFIAGLIFASSHFMTNWVAIPIVLANVVGYAEGKLKPSKRSSDQEAS